MTWICDPERDVNDGSNFNGFEVAMSKEELTEDSGYFDIQDLEIGVMSDLLERAKANTNDTRELSKVESNKLAIYHHFTKRDGRWVLTSWGRDRKQLIRFVELPAVTPEEVKDPSLIPDPVVIRHRCPLR